MMAILQQKRHCFTVEYGTSEAMADVITDALLEQFFQRFLRLDGDDTILLLIGIDTPTEHQFNNITDAAVVAVGNGANLVNKFSVADSVKSYPVCSYCNGRRWSWLCRFLMYIVCAATRCAIGLL